MCGECESGTKRLIGSTWAGACRARGMCEGHVNLMLLIKKDNLTLLTRTKGNIVVAKPILAENP